MSAKRTWHLLWHKRYRLYNVTGFELLCFVFPYFVYAIEGELSLFLTLGVLPKGRVFTSWDTQILKQSQKNRKHRLRIVFSSVRASPWGCLPLPALKCSLLFLILQLLPGLLVCRKGTHPFCSKDGVVPPSVCNKDISTTGTRFLFWIFLGTSIVNPNLCMSRVRQV